MKPFKTITLRLNAGEYAHLRKQAEATGLKMEPLLRLVPVQCVVDGLRQGEGCFLLVLGVVQAFVQPVVDDQDFCICH